jgi:hypothetical protein
LLMLIADPVYRSGVPIVWAEAAIVRSAAEQIAAAAKVIERNGRGIGKTLLTASSTKFAPTESATSARQA